jgi:hypothetical protein
MQSAGMFQERSVPQYQDLQLQRNLLSAINHALGESRMRCIVSTEGFCHEKVADIVCPTNWTCLSVDQIIAIVENGSGKFSEITSSRGIFVTGYSNRLSEEQEDSLQSFVRKICFANSSLGLIVLADTLPAIDIFSMQRPWYNGPFEYQNPYGVTLRGLAVNLARYTKEGDRFSETPPYWKMFREITFAVS